MSSPRVEKFPAFQTTRSFITPFTSARHLSLSWATSIQSMSSHPTSWRSILISSSRLRLGLPSGLFPSGVPLPQNAVYTSTVSLIRVTCRANHTLLDFMTRTILGEEYRSWSFSLCSFLYSLVISSPLGPNSLHNNLFWNTLSLRSSLNICDPYKATGKIIVLYMLIFKFLDSKLEDKRFCLVSRVRW